jgi:hypothetical protein
LKSKEILQLREESDQLKSLAQTKQNETRQALVQNSMMKERYEDCLMELERVRQEVNSGSRKLKSETPRDFNEDEK